MIWTILTAQIREEIYNWLISHGLFPEEQKGCHKGTREVDDWSAHLQGKQSDVKKGKYGVDWQQNGSWYCLTIFDRKLLEYFKISNKIIKFITKAMKKWKMELVAGGKTLSEVKILWDITKGDTLTLLLLVIAMMSLNCILRKGSGATNLQNRKKRLTTLHQGKNKWGDWFTQ